MHPLEHCQRIKKLVAEHYGLAPAALEGVSRERHLITARGVAMLLIRETAPSMTTTMLGRAFRRDRSTIGNALVSIGNAIETDAFLRNDVSDLRERLKPGRIDRLAEQHVLQHFQFIND